MDRYIADHGLSGRFSLVEVTQTLHKDAAERLGHELRGDRRAYILDYADA